jgi:hypothetical protein
MPVFNSWTLDPDGSGKNKFFIFSVFGHLPISYLEDRNGNSEFMAALTWWFWLPHHHWLSSVIRL